MAALHKATIHVLGVDTEESKSHIDKIFLEAEQIEKIIEKHKLACKVKIISGEYVADVLLKYAKKVKADLIIAMSDMDKTAISEYFSGPVVQQIVNHSPIPVFSIRPSFNPNTVDLHGYGW